MIARACYVMCDECGNPADVSTEGAGMARRMAKVEGFVRRDGRDFCPDCSAEARPAPAETPPTDPARRAPNQQSSAAVPEGGAR